MKLQLVNEYDLKELQEKREIQRKFFKELSKTSDLLVVDFKAKKLDLVVPLVIPKKPKIRLRNSLKTRFKSA
jgi:hypothetical protein